MIDTTGTSGDTLLNGFSACGSSRRARSGCSSSSCGMVCSGLYPDDDPETIFSGRSFLKESSLTEFSLRKCSLKESFLEIFFLEESECFIRSCNFVYRLFREECNFSLLTASNVSYRFNALTYDFLAISTSPVSIADDVSSINALTLDISGLMPDTEGLISDAVESVDTSGPPCVDAVVSMKAPRVNCIAIGFFINSCS